MAQPEQPDRTLDALTRWAQSRDDVSAVIITSTRAVPGARLDAYSDYDVIVVVDGASRSRGTTSGLPRSATSSSPIGTR